MSSPSAETALENDVIGNELPLSFKVRKYFLIDPDYFYGLSKSWSLHSLRAFHAVQMISIEI